MRALLVGIALALILFCFSDEAISFLAQPEEPAATVNCPECPGGVCPRTDFLSQAADSLRSLANRPRTDFAPSPNFKFSLIDNTVPSFIPLTAQVVTLPVGNPPIKNPEPVTLVSAPIKPALATGKNGWRMRLFYPPRAAQIADDIKAELEGDHNLRQFALDHGFDSATTDSPEFTPWRESGYPQDQISLVLVSPDSRSVYYVHRVLKDSRELLVSLQERAEVGQSCANGHCHWQDWGEPNYGEWSYGARGGRRW